MEVSVGILYSSHTFLMMARRAALTSNDFRAAFERIEVADAKSVIETCERCAWIKLTECGEIVVTARGAAICDLVDDIQRLRQQLADVILATKPPWSKQIPRGRFETVKILPPASSQCFKEADLLESTFDDVVQWWREIGGRLRSERDIELSDTGVEAERYTLKHEEARTGRVPLWQGFESTLSGFDVLSVVAEEDKRRLKIEVKGTKLRLKEAGFFLTRNEWETAIASENYVFHLWLLRGLPKCFCVDRDAVAMHVPIDNNDGEWQKTRIPYNPFATYEITPKI